MTNVRLIKVDVNAPTDRALQRIVTALHASSTAEAVRCGLGIADYITQAHLAGKRVLVVDVDGRTQELIAG